MQLDKLAILCAVVSVTLAASCDKKQTPQTRPPVNSEPRPGTRVQDADPRPPEPPAPGTEPPAATKCFSEGYPEYVTKASMDEDVAFLHLEQTRIRWDDGREKTFEQKLARPDLEDTVSITYSTGEPDEPPRPNEDPGRIRHDDFLKHIYGDSESAVRDNLVSVKWPGEGTVAFNERNGAAEALQSVADELARLPAKYKKYFTKTAGTFNWRNISGTDRMSAHSFAIAIDLNVDFSNYWRWQDKTGANLEYQNRIPWEIVEIFERHGFIWGGKWYHYDTMHFEYRPELLEPGCARRHQD